MLSEQYIPTHITWAYAQIHMRKSTTTSKHYFTFFARNECNENRYISIVLHASEIISKIQTLGNKRTIQSVREREIDGNEFCLPHKKLESSKWSIFSCDCQSSGAPIAVCSLRLNCAHISSNIVPITANKNIMCTPTALWNEERVEKSKANVNMCGLRTNIDNMANISLSNNE